MMMMKMVLVSGFSIVLGVQAGHLVPVPVMPPHPNAVESDPDSRSLWWAS